MYSYEPTHIDYTYTCTHATNLFCSFLKNGLYCAHFSESYFFLNETLLIYTEQFYQREKELMDLDNSVVIADERGV